MAQKIKCINCGREEKGINSAKNDGWIIEEDNKIFCCVLCKTQYRQKQQRVKRASKKGKINE